MRRRARRLFETYLDIFGDDYYIEIQDHGIPDQKQCNHVLLKWAAEYGVKVIATNDVHYIKQEDAAAQDVLALPADRQRPLQIPTACDLRTTNST